MPSELTKDHWRNDINAEHAELAEARLSDKPGPRKHENTKPTFGSSSCLRDFVVAFKSEGLRVLYVFRVICQEFPAARFSNRVNSRMNASLTTPVGPLRCLPTMSSATPCASVGGWLRSTY